MLNSLHLEGFRNLAGASLDFASGINLFYGSNGAGKTNLLEAIGMFALGKSCRGSKDNELVNFDRELTELTANITGQKKKLISP